MRQIQLVVTDLDGTLLDKNKQISDEAVETIRELKRQGKQFTFVTGRPASGITAFADRAEIDIPIVTCNGAEMVKQGQIIVQHSMNVKALRDIMETAKNAGMTVLYYHDGIEYAMSVTQWVEIRRAAGRPYPVVQHTDEFWETQKAEKVTIVNDKGTECFEKLRPELNRIEGKYELCCYGTAGCEIIGKGINKASGLLELSGLLNVPMTQILAVGDNENDNEMLREAGIGAAVANAVAATKENADYLCAREMTDGVVEAIRKFCLSAQ